jgi:hypothetical protein
MRRFDNRLRRPGPLEHRFGSPIRGLVLPMALAVVAALLADRTLPSLLLGGLKLAAQLLPAHTASPPGGL